MPLHFSAPDVEQAVPLSIAIPVFEIAARRNTITLSGTTVSAQHERELKRITAAAFPDREHRFQFRPLGVAPEWWSQTTRELTNALGAMSAPGARLDQGLLRVRALAANPPAAELRLDHILDLLPATHELDIRIGPAGPDIRARSLCERHFENFTAGAANFEESGTVFRTSAYPVLDRVVVLADACRGATVSITGHTDSSGTEAGNQWLSLARAQAVADYLADRGIDAARLRATGVGSAQPVASNETRYGRSLNRRIEISLIYEDQAYSGAVSLTSSISNNNVAFGGTGGLPRAP